MVVYLSASLETIAMILMTLMNAMILMTLMTARRFSMPRRAHIEVNRCLPF